MYYIHGSVRAIPTYRVYRLYDIQHQAVAYPAISMVVNIWACSMNPVRVEWGSPCFCILLVKQNVLCRITASSKGIIKFQISAQGPLMNMLPLAHSDRNWLESKMMTVSPISHIKSLAVFIIKPLIGIIKFLHYILHYNLCTILLWSPWKPPLL